MTVTIFEEHFKGGKNLADEGDTTNCLSAALRAIITAITAMKQPSLSAAAVSAVSAADITAVSGADIAAVTEPAVSATGGVADGLITGAPTTPSSQAVDPGGFTTWNVNVSAGYGFVNAVGKYNAAQVDLAISTGAKIMDIGQAMYAWLVWKEAAGTVTQQVVLGTAAALGAETIPDDAAITAAVTHARWAKLALCHASRTADAVVATTQDPSLMLKWGGSGGALMNELRTIAGTVRTLLNELKVKQGTNLTLENELKTRAAEVRTLVNEARTDLMAQSAVALGIVNG
jgi:hypothetical protein